MRRYVLLISIFIIICVKGNCEAKSDQYIYPKLGVFGNNSVADSGFKDGEGSSFSAGGSVGLWVLFFAGVDFSHETSRFNTSRSGEYSYIKNSSLSLSIPILPSTWFKSNLNFLPYVSLGVGRYNLNNETSHIGENIGLKIIYFPFVSKSKNGSLMGLEFGSYYNRFPNEGRSIGYSEIRAGITVWLIGD